MTTPSASSSEERSSHMHQSCTSPCSTIVVEPLLLPTTVSETNMPSQVLQTLPESIAFSSRTRSHHTGCPLGVDKQDEVTGKMAQCLPTTCESPSISSDYVQCSPGHGIDVSRSAGFCNASVCGSGSDEDTSQSHPVKSRLRQRKTPIRYASCSTVTSGADSADEDTHLRKRPRTAVEPRKNLRDDSYEPPDSNSNEDEAAQRTLLNGFLECSGSSETEMEEEVNSICSLPPRVPRCQKTVSSANSTVPRKSTRQKSKTTSGNSLRRSSSAADQCGMPSPSYSHSSDGESHAQAPTAKFEEWPLERAVLKRITINGSATFQLEFNWEPCGNNHVKARGSSNKNPLPRARPGAKRRVAAKDYSPEEDSLLIALKAQGLSWKDIHAQYKERFPGRTMGSLQVRYSTKLNK